MDSTQQSIVDEFQFLESWTEKYQYLIDLGQALSDCPSHLKTDSNLVKGCQSQVWLHCQKKVAVLNFEGTSDSAIVRGLMAILFRIFNGKAPETILETKLECFESIGLKKHLSMTRNNGLYAMIERIRHYAKENQSNEERTVSS